MNEQELKSIKKDDILYEFCYGGYIESKVLENPTIEEKVIKWQGLNTKTGEIIDYLVNLDYLHYAPKLYTYMAYSGCKQY